MTRRAPEVLPTMPSVNLLSQSEFDRMAARKLRHRFIAGGLMLVVLVGAATGAQHMRLKEAQKLVAVEQSETSRLTAQTQVLAPVKAFVNGVAVQQRTVDTAMANEVFFSEVLGGIREATPPGAQLVSVDITLAPPPDPNAPADTPSACPGPDPYNTRVVVGCVQLSGTAGSRAEVGDMVIALGSSKLFVEPFISTTTTGDADEVTFSGSVGLSEKVYSGRYTDETTESAPQAEQGGES
jgi:Tfp pilus assembly protein PilN